MCPGLKQASWEAGNAVSVVRAGLLGDKHHCVVAGQSCQSALSAGGRVMRLQQSKTDPTTSELSRVSASVGIGAGVSLVSQARADLLRDKEGCGMGEQVHQSAMGAGRLEGWWGPLELPDIFPSNLR